MDGTRRSCRPMVCVPLRARLCSHRFHGGPWSKEVWAQVVTLAQADWRSVTGINKQLEKFPDFERNWARCDRQAHSDQLKRSPNSPPSSVASVSLAFM